MVAAKAVVPDIPLANLKGQALAYEDDPAISNCLHRGLAGGVPNKVTVLDGGLDHQAVRRGVSFFNPAVLSELLDLREQAELRPYHELFLRSAHSLVQSIDEALQGHNWRELSEQANRLKSASATLGAGELAGACLELEMACHVGMEEEYLISQRLELVKVQFRTLERILS